MDDNTLASRGCAVEDGIGCFYKVESAWCASCKARKRLEASKKTKEPHAETWGERANRERKYIRIPSLGGK